MMLIEMSLFLLKPDALRNTDLSTNTRAQLFQMISDHELQTICSITFRLTYDVLVSYQPSLNVLNTNVTISAENISRTLDYQLGMNRKGKMHTLLVVAGNNAIRKALHIKKVIRDKYCSAPGRISPENFVHTPDNALEFAQDIGAFNKIIQSIELAKIRRAK